MLSMRVAAVAAGVALLSLAHQVVWVVSLFVQEEEVIRAVGGASRDR